ncbi:hypothetical protein AVEN_98658-1 [Araneus ventricosus]|uniref:Uncharacterized protein n=1 Tax=Araneus ventricosus TaxID=182803 RepID=A0A4Y2KM36_ARAVE|nr:hypothetical protein AVEN_98658-1 [Araneus ventricosus]
MHAPLLKEEIGKLLFVLIWRDPSCNELRKQLSRNEDIDANPLTTQGFDAGLSPHRNAEVSGVVERKSMRPPTCNQGGATLADDTEISSSSIHHLIKAFSTTASAAFEPFFLLSSIRNAWAVLKQTSLVLESFISQFSTEANFVS